MISTTIRAALLEKACAAPNADVPNALRAPPTVITSGLMGGHELRSARKAMVVALTRSRATSSPSLPASCASSFTALGASLALRVARPRGNIPKSGTCGCEKNWCSDCPDAHVRVVPSASHLYAHIAAGFPDPLQGRVRLWASLQGLARWENAPVRKVPVTPSMLGWVRRKLKLSGGQFVPAGSSCLGRLNTFPP